jgi:hypothetical protein
MLTIIFYSLLIFGLVIAINPLINLLLLFIRDTWDKYIEWDKKRIHNWMDAYHRGEGNYEYYDPDKPIEEEDIPHVWNEELLRADYDKYDDPFYIGDDDEEKH